MPRAPGVVNRLRDADILAAHRTVLAFDLIDLAERLLTRTDLMASTGFASVWQTIAGAPPGFLARAVDDPALPAWTVAMRTLLRNGVVDRYPQHHPSRHLKALGSLVMSWAADLPAGRSGAVPSLGWRTLPLDWGRAGLTSTGRMTSSDLFWIRTDDALEIRLGKGFCILAMSVPSGSVRCVSRGWKYTRFRAVDALTIEPRPDDVAHAAYARACRDLEKAMRSLPEKSRAIVTSYLRRIRLVTRVDAWVAGLAQIPVARAQDRYALLDAALGDRTERARRLQPWLPRPVPRPARAAPADVPQVLRLHSTSRVGCFEARLWKTRRAGAKSLDWTALDTLARVDRATVGLIGESVDTSGAEEASSYLAAICGYRLGRFADAAADLLACLQIDSDVEEYWCLLGFALRQLGERHLAERLLLDPARSRAVFAKVAVALARHTPCRATVPMEALELHAWQV